jgi:hypothetical protein
MSITVKPQTYDGGRTDIECTRCTWALPGVQYRGHSHPNPGTAYADRVIGGEVSDHIRATGHPVRITLTTFHRNGHVEQSAMRIGGHDRRPEFRE